MDDIFKRAKVVIWWSEENKCYRADVSSDDENIMSGTLKTHGDSMEEALKNAKEVFELGVESDRKWREENKS